MKSITIFFTLILLGITACNKELLDKAPLDTFPEDAVWQDVKLVQAYVNNFYTVLPQFGSNRGLILSSASDEGYNKFNFNSVPVINTGILTPDNIGDFDNWSNMFRMIQRTNIFFSKIDAVPGDEAVRKRLMGEAGYMRAYCYFELIRDYGGVPIITTPFGLTDNFELSRNTYYECIDFIVAELDKAASLLPAEYNDSPDNLGRVTKGAALALKSRILIYAASPLWNVANDKTMWQKASDAAKAVIDMPNYRLFTGNYPDIFSTNFNSEIIFARLLNKDYGSHSADVYLSPNGFHGWAAFAPSQNLVDAFETSKGLSIQDAASGYNPQNPYVNRDPRFYADIIFDGGTYRKPADHPDRGASGNKAEFFEGGLDSQQGLDNWNASLTRYAFRKYCDTTYNMTVSPNQFNQPWIVSRLAEIYLNYAEAKFYLGDEVTARQYINLIRHRAKMPDVPASITGKALEAKIQNERRVELCLEGHRFYDVRRWKIAEMTENKPLQQVIITKKPDNTRSFLYQTLQQRVFVAPQHYLLPIPTNEINRTSLTQNPGYK